jgi:NTP pyrophosphatase (non-canonical NTP hydrolase)
VTFDEYQKEAHKTAIYPGSIGLAYVTMGLVGEAGEIANKVKKIYRDRHGCLSDDDCRELGKELGDVLWYCAELATVLNAGLGNNGRTKN